jgi:hypothetical protein
VVDYTLFWIPATRIEEAHYLTAVINSETLRTTLEPLMPKGQFGARHVQKHLWRLAIPTFDNRKKLHNEIAATGAKLSQEAQSHWDEVQETRKKRNQSISITVVRRELRDWMRRSAGQRRLETLMETLMRETIS